MNALIAGRPLVPPIEASLDNAPQDGKRQPPKTHDNYQHDEMPQAVSHGLTLPDSLNDRNGSEAAGLLLERILSVLSATGEADPSIPDAQYVDGLLNDQWDRADELCLRIKLGQ